jgi:hypothetical protein
VHSPCSLTSRADAPCISQRGYWWAEKQNGKDSELTVLCAWLSETIAATRRHRKEQRRSFAIKARLQAEQDAAGIPPGLAA